ncbi:NADH:flavin oxidoreductase [Pseudomonas sp. TCU-HL1]|uniref:NADH:flavin oxidoreductase n=1 Tax=Pseudomonas sp. TCU-HL1 TaxID=1856685 RepID=UPI00083E6201|nr:NADH:flavin oxidoreductase [Pseudomonas sp. TCU-HL1]AOE83856.1 NADH:flavin oxidoreductase [Pseudomonas sp. TCU-HL1]
MSPQLHGLLQPARLAGLELRNRLIKTATFEGMCPGGVPGEDLIRHHAAMARGGVGLTTVAYCGVSPDGLTFPDQMWMHAGIFPQLQRLTAVVHGEGGAISAQLAHCGYFSRNRPLNIPRPRGPSACINQYGLFSGIPVGGAMDASDIGRTVAEYAAAASLVRDAGFDAIEIHMGHGYLLSQFISPALNHRRDAYGGSLDNRMRLPLQVLTAVRGAVGRDFPLLAKLNLSDGFKAGLQIEEACQAARLLEQAGLDAIVMSGGLVSRTPMFLFRGASPLKQMVPLEKNPLQRTAMKWFGGASFPDLPFEELYFLELARQMRRTVDMPLVYLGGVASAEGMAQVADEGFEFLALGRALLHDPELPKRLQHEGETWRSACTHCNQCVASMGLPGGIRCVLNEPTAFA